LDADNDIPNIAAHLPQVKAGPVLLVAAVQLVSCVDFFVAAPCGVAAAASQPAVV